MRAITTDDRRAYLDAYDAMLSDAVPALPPDAPAVGYNAKTPIRAETPPPRGLREYAQALGLPVAVADPWDNYPMYMPKPYPRVQLPRPYYFESDAAVWHGFIHEAAHHLHFYKHGHLAEVRLAAMLHPGESPNAGPGTLQFKLRADTEVVAESAAYMTLDALKLVYKPEYSKAFVGSWSQHTKVGEQHLRTAIAIAHELAEVYRDVVKG